MPKKKKAELVVTFSGEDEFILGGKVKNPEKFSFISGQGTAPSEGATGVVGTLTPPSGSGSGTTSGGTSGGRPIAIQPMTEPIPTNSDVDGMSCPTLTAKIGAFQSYLNTYSTALDPVTKENIQTFLSYANQVYNRKCSVSSGGGTPDPANPDTTGVVNPLPTLLTYAELTGLTCDRLQAQINVLNSYANVFANSQNTQAKENYRLTLAYANDLLVTKNCNAVTPPSVPLPELITEDTLATLSCDRIKEEITLLNSYASAFANSTDTQAKGIYRATLDYANSLLVTKNCNAPTPPAPSPIIIGGGLPTGGLGMPPMGGGGGGGSDESQTTTTTEVKTSYSWLWLLLLAGGIYAITKKRKK